MTFRWFKWYYSFIVAAFCAAGAVYDVLANGNKTFGWLCAISALVFSGLNVHAGIRLMKIQRG